MELRTLVGRLYLLSTLFVLFAPSAAAQHVNIEGSESIIFPPGNNVPLLRSLSTSVHLLGASVIAYCIARRMRPNSFRASRLIKWLVLCIFIDSWLFVFSAGVLISGVGLSLNPRSCSAGIFLCICLYAISKLLIYSFLVEKLYIVHPHPGGRLRSPVYRFCAAFVLGYGIIIILSIVGRISFIRSDGACFIGLGRVASSTLLVYDLLLNIVFTGFFMYPIHQVKTLPPRLKVIAKRTLIAAVVALVTSAINIFVLTILHGKELGALCLGSCGLDTVVNALAIFAVTAPVDEAAGPCNETDTCSQGIVSEVSHGLARFLPSRRYPRIVNVGVTSTRGILETEDGDKRNMEYKSSTRSVHFPPEITRQDRLSMTEINLEAGMTQMTLVDSDPLQTTLSHKSSKRSSKHSVKPLNSRVSAPILPRHQPSLSVTTLGKRESTTTTLYDVQDYSIPSTVHAPRPPSPEDTSVEVRREGGGSMRLSRSSREPSTWSFTNGDGPARPRARSASVSVAGSSSATSTPSANQSRSQTDTIDLTYEPGSLAPPPRAVLRSPPAAQASSIPAPPCTIDEARERLQVLSALTEATGGGRRSPSRTSGAALEVSVTMHTDQRVEQKKRRKDLIDDYSGSLYNVRGRSYSSSGGL